MIARGVTLSSQMLSPRRAMATHFEPCFMLLQKCHPGLVLYASHQKVCNLEMDRKLVSESTVNRAPDSAIMSIGLQLWALAHSVFVFTTCRALAHFNRTFEVFLRRDPIGPFRARWAHGAKSVPKSFRRNTEKTVRLVDFWKVNQKHCSVCPSARGFAFSLKQQKVCSDRRS